MRALGIGLLMLAALWVLVIVSFIGDIVSFPA